MDKDYEQGIRDFLNAIPEPEFEPEPCDIRPLKMGSTASGCLYIEREDGPELIGRWDKIASGAGAQTVIPSAVCSTASVTADAFSATTYSIQDIIDAIERLGGTIRPS